MAPKSRLSSLHHQLKKQKLHTTEKEKYLLLPSIGSLSTLRRFASIWFSRITI